MARRRRSLVAFLCVACASFAPAAGAHPLIGIADEKLALFSDPRFLALGITQVRYYMAWNVLSVGGYRRAELTAWLTDARDHGLTPLITIDHANGRGSRRLPSVAQYSRAFLAFRARFPWVTQFATWNEANYYGEAIATHPQLAAEYYLALRRDCPSCTILAAELLDITNPSEAVPEALWAHEFIHYAGTQPPLWGLHNYVSANRFQTSGTRDLLAAVRGDIWFTETAGIVDLHHHASAGYRENPRHAASVDRFILHTLTALSPRIQRVYLYEWNAAPAHKSWDSALVSRAGVLRPAYDVLANTLVAWGVQPNCVLSSAPPSCAAK